MSLPTNNDPVLHSIDAVIEMIEKDQPGAENLPKIPSREEILNTHLAFVKTYLLLQ
jgi:hypothetical protein